MKILGLPNALLFVVAPMACLKTDFAWSLSRIPIAWTYISSATFAGFPLTTFCVFFDVKETTGFQAERSLSILHSMYGHHLVQFCLYKYSATMRQNVREDRLDLCILLRSGAVILCLQRPFQLETLPLNVFWTSFDISLKSLIRVVVAFMLWTHVAIVWSVGTPLFSPAWRCRVC